jgi:hypothetical protein
MRAAAFAVLDHEESFTTQSVDLDGGRAVMSRSSQ